MVNSNGSSNSLRPVWQELNRRHPDDPYAWMMAHGSRAGHPFTPLRYLADIARDRHSLVAVQKAAQVGVTELLVHLALHTADTGYAGRGHALYLMPTESVMRDFAQSRFDRAIQDSEYLRGRLTPQPPRRRGADSTRLKRIGNGHVFMRGAESTRQLASVDPDLVVLDEYDHMGEEVLGLAQKRVASSQAPRVIVASTPRYPEAGINALYLQSDQRRYFLTCPGCGLEQTLKWEGNVDRDRALVVCWRCRKPLNVLARGRWIPEAPGNARIHGYHLSRLYSPWANLPEMIESSAALTPAELQRFQNDDLGEAFMPPGGGLTLDALDRSRAEYSLRDYDGQTCVMGIDVGTHLHVVIRELPADDALLPRARLWFARVVDWNELDRLLKRFNVTATVIDAQPETRMASEFAIRNRRVWLARYDRHTGEHQVEDGIPSTYHLDRLVALDECFERFRKGEAEIPREARELGGRVKDGFGDYYRQVMAPQRTLEQDASGNWVARWLDHQKADHFAHAEVYCLCAAKVARLMRVYWPKSRGKDWLDPLRVGSVHPASINFRF